MPIFWVHGRVNASQSRVEDLIRLRNMVLERKPKEVWVLMENSPIFGTKRANFEPLSIWHKAVAMLLKDSRQPEKRFTHEFIRRLESSNSEVARYLKFLLSSLGSSKSPAELTRDELQRGSRKLKLVGASKEEFANYLRIPEVMGFVSEDFVLSSMEMLNIVLADYLRDPYWFRLHIQDAPSAIQLQS